MPWTETAPMNERMRFVTDWERDLYSMVELCERYGVSRKTGYKWPRGRRRAASCSITSRSSTTGGGGIRRSAISARGRSSGGANRKRWQLNPGVYETGASPHRFTNVYRASDRVSQYLIRNVIYSAAQTAEEIFFRTVMVKLFNRISTWEQLQERVGEISWRTYRVRRIRPVSGRGRSLILCETSNDRWCSA